MTVGYFIKKYLGTLSNVLVVLLVIGAIYVKSESEGADSLFRSNDLYILAGALLALVLLRFIGRKKK